MQEPSPPLPLATIRKRKLLSQRALASQAGLALSTVHLLEAGKTERTTFKVMRAISDALGVAPESIAEFRRAMDSHVALESRFGHATCGHRQLRRWPAPAAAA